MKCMWRNLKMMNDRSGELEFSAILRETHEFLVELPPSWWQQRPSDTPFRTIRTIIHSLAKIRNTRIFDDIPADIPQGSELFSYITRIIKVRLLKKIKLRNLSNGKSDSFTNLFLPCENTAYIHMLFVFNNFFDNISDHDNRQSNIGWQFLLACFAAPANWVEYRCGFLDEAPKRN